jgi:ribosome biogenesis GTPase
MLENVKMKHILQSRLCWIGMSKKKLSLQQRQRISQKHQELRAELADDLFEGLVITRTKNQALIESQKHHEQVLCAIRPDLATVVEGDRVCWRRTTTQQGVVESIFPRQTQISRFDRYGQEKILAANVSQMIIVIAPKPEPSELLIDSYLVGAEIFGIRACIVFNKKDLDQDNEFSRLKAIYAPLCHALVANDNLQPNLIGLHNILAEQQSIFVGQSGVGKSTIIQHLLPEQAETIATSPLSSTHHFGQHTTSATFYFHLAQAKGAIIDSPGVRAFSLGQLRPEQWLWGFKEFRPFIGQCRFRDCKHQSDPGCAIQEAVKNHAISPKRYENYVKLRTSLF